MEKVTEILFATNNHHKLEEVRTLFAPYEVHVFSLADLFINSDPVEDGEQFADNALIKVQALRSLTTLPIIADDSGLEILALDGFPGVHSARFMEGEDYPAKCLSIIEKLKPFSDKRAAFTCALAFSMPQQITHIFIGQCPGLITEELHGEAGFGYDPIFYAIELDKTFAEASSTEKNVVSHRGRAFKQLIDYMMDQNYLPKLT